MLARRRDHGPPAARRPGLLDGHLGQAPMELAGLRLGAHDVEGEVLENAQPDPVAERFATVLAAVLLVHRGRRPGESVAMEGAVHDRGHPPAGDGVAAELEQAGGHS